MNVCEEHKNEREARGPERTEREARDDNVPANRQIFFAIFRLIQSGRTNFNQKNFMFLFFWKKFSKNSHLHEAPPIKMYFMSLFSLINFTIILRI